MVKKQIIWTNDYDENDIQSFYQSQKSYIDNYVENIDDFYQDMDDSLDDERMNLNKEIDGVIIAMASVGTWRGKFNGYKIIGTNIKDILFSGSDYVEWFGDTNNIRSTETHHDGTNIILYRVAKDMLQAEKIAEKIYNNEMNEQQFMRVTKSLYPYIGDIYGWKTKKFKKK